MVRFNRREVIQAGALLSGAAAAGSWLEVAARAHSGNAECPWQQEYTFGHTVLFMEEYYQGTLDILGAQSGELEQIGDLTSRAASLVRKGGTVWTSMNLGTHALLRAERRPPRQSRHHEDPFNLTGSREGFRPDAEGRHRLYQPGQQGRVGCQRAGRLRGLRHYQLLEQRVQASRL